MRMTWRERLAQYPRLRDFNVWPAIPLDSLPPQRRRAYLRNRAIVAQALDGRQIGAVAAAHQVTAGRVSQLLDRCLGGDTERPPALSAALIPYRILASKRRVSPLPRLQTARGTACAFQALLAEVPGLRTGLDAMIKAHLDDKAYAQRLTPQAFHGEVKRILTENHWPQDQYPYTTASQGYDAARRYLHARTAEVQIAREQQRRQPRLVGDPARLAPRALRTIQIDEHTLDLQGRVNLLLHDALIPLRIARASVLVAVDAETQCALGYFLTPARAPNQQHLLTLLERCLHPWPLPTLTTPGLQYAPGAAFPSGLPEAFPVSFGTVQLDNALMHRAQSVRELLCHQMGATLSFGLPAQPKTRQEVESVFKYIEAHCGHRVASTSGSHPTDPAKESRKNRCAPPVTTFQTLDEALCVILTEGNVTPVAALGDAAPLGLFQHQCATHFVRYVPPELTQHWRPLTSSVEVPVHWYRHEHRLPHVTFQYERYQGPGLLRVAGKRRVIRVEFDRRDIRTLHAFSPDGEDLGILHAPKSWQRYPHSVATRQHLHQKARSYRLGRRDPLGDYFRYLLDRCGQPKVALSLLRVYTEFTAGTAAGLLLGTSTPSDASPRPPSASPAWNSTLADHRS